ncbi:MAG: CAP domain-containing protein [Actinomycetota bacterium]
MNESSQLLPLTHPNMQKLFAGMALAMLVLVGGCEAWEGLDQLLPVPKAPSPSPTVKIPSPTAMELSIQQQVNQYRTSRQLSPLTLDPRITEQARIHSQNMANGKVPFSHQGFEQRIQAIGRSLAYNAAAENVAFNLGFSDPARQAVQGWIKSPGHRENMEGNYNLTGIGIAKNAKGEYYFTQLFIRSR